MIAACRKSEQAEVGVVSRRQGSYSGFPGTQPAQTLPAGMYGDKAPALHAVKLDVGDDMSTRRR